MCESLPTIGKFSINLKTVTTFKVIEEKFKIKT